MHRHLPAVLVGVLLLATWVSAQDKGRAAQKGTAWTVVFVDANNRTVRAQDSKGATRSFKITNKTRVMGPRGGESQGLKDERFVKGAIIRVVFKGDDVSKIYLPYRSGIEIKSEKSKAKTKIKTKDNEVVKKKADDRKKAPPFMETVKKKRGETAPADANESDVRVREKEQELQRKARDRRESELQLREELQRRKAVLVSRMNLKQRERIQALETRSNELRKRLERKNEELRLSVRRNADLRTRLRTAKVRRDQLSSTDILLDRAVVKRLKSQVASETALRVATERALAAQALHDADVYALSLWRTQVLADLAMSEAERAWRINAIHNILLQDAQIKRSESFSLSFKIFVPEVVVKPATVQENSVPKESAASTLPTYTIPEVKAADTFVEGASKVQVLPGAVPEVEKNSDDAETAPLVDDAPVTQSTRYLRVANGTAKPLRIFLRYETETEEGSFKWFPGALGRPLSLELAPEEEADVFDNDWRLQASRVTIWAESESKSWSQFKTQPLLLVPEVDADGNHTYQAPLRDVFSYTFTDADSSDAKSEDKPVDKP